MPTGREPGSATPLPTRIGECFGMIYEKNPTRGGKLSTLEPNGMTPPQLARFPRLPTPPTISVRSGRFLPLRKSRKYVSGRIPLPKGEGGAKHRVRGAEIL